MKITNVILFTSALLVSACGSKNSAQPYVAKKGKTPTHSQADFPYIEAFHSGMRYKIKGDVDAAIVAFTKCLDIKQNDDAVYFALSQLYQEKKNSTLAIQMMTKAAELDPKNIWYTEELAVLYYDNQQFEKAVPFFKKLVDKQPTNLAWLYGYGDCLLRTGKVNESIQVLNKAEDVMGKNPSLSLEKYNLYMNLKKDKEAVAELESILKVYPDEPQVIATLVDHYFKRNEIDKGVVFLKELVKADPENGRAHLTLGEIYRHNGKIADAFKEYNAAFKCQDIDIDTKMSLMINLQETPHATSKEAMDLADLMIIQHPNEAKSHSIKGDLLVMLEKEEEALRSYQTALTFDKKQFPIWNQVLILEYQIGLWEELYNDSKSCLEYFSTMPIVYLLNGVSANLLKKPTQAVESLSVGKSLLVGDKRMEAEFYGQLGESYFQLKEIDSAKMFYKEAIQKDPESNLLKNNFAYRLATSKTEMELAMSLINQAITRSPSQANYYDTRGWIYFQQGKFDNALTDFMKALELEPKNATYLEHIGDALIKSNQKDKAIEKWEEAVINGSKSETIQRKIVTKTYHEE